MRMQGAGFFCASARNFGEMGGSRANNYISRMRAARNVSKMSTARAAVLIGVFCPARFHSAQNGYNVSAGRARPRKIMSKLRKLLTFYYTCERST